MRMCVKTSMTVVDASRKPEIAPRITGGDSRKKPVLASGDETQSRWA
jgi:hypothetical protein